MAQGPLLVEKVRCAAARCGRGTIELPARRGRRQLHETPRCGLACGRSSPSGRTLRPRQATAPAKSSHHHAALLENLAEQDKHGTRELAGLTLSVVRPSASCPDSDHGQSPSSSSRSLTLPRVNREDLRDSTEQLRSAPPQEKAQATPFRTTSTGRGNRRVTRQIHRMAVGQLQLSLYAQQILATARQRGHTK